MKKNIKKALLVCVVICIVAMLLPSCAKKGETLMSLDGSTLSVNTYSLLLSRMKGTLKYYGYSVEDDSFFRQIISSDGETLDSYFSDEIFEKAKIYLIADYLFDKHGLMLDGDREAEIEGLISDMQKSLGSRSALNGELKKYGVNIDMLREVYITEAKIDMLREYYCGEDCEKIPTAVREEYLEENYVAFSQIFIAAYYTVEDKDGNSTAVYFDDEKLSQLRAAAQGYAEECRGDAEKFLSCAKLYDESGENGGVMYLKVSDGYYESKSSSAAYLDKIAKGADALEVGECAMIETDFGYHVIMRCENIPEAYEKEEYGDVFADFYSSLAEKIFEDKCAEYEDLIVINEEALGAAPTISGVEANILY